MSAWDLNLQIPYQAPGFTAQGLSSLGQGVAQAIQKQQQDAAEAEQLQYEAIKNQTIVQNLYKQKMVTPEQYLEFQNAAPKKQKSIAEGIAANVHFNMMVEKERRANAPLNVQPVAVPGGTPLNVLQGQGMTPRPLTPPAAPPAAPSMGVVVDPLTKQPRTVFNPGGSANAGASLQPAPTPDPKIVPVPVPGGGTQNVFTGPGTLIKPGETEKAPLIERLTPEILEQGRAAGKIPLPQSDGSVVWFDSKEFSAKENPAVKVFDDTIGKTYGVKSADIFKLNLTEPDAVKYMKVGPDGKDVKISTEEAVALGSGAIAVIPIGDPATTTTTRRLPLPEWNTILNQWKGLPRAGSITTDPRRVDAANTAGPAGGRTLSAQDQKLLDWALANPSDARAAQIKARLGIP